MNFRRVESLKGRRFHAARLIRLSGHLSDVLLALICSPITPAKTSRNSLVFIRPCLNPLNHGYGRNDMKRCLFTLSAFLITPPSKVSSRRFNVLVILRESDFCQTESVVKFSESVIAGRQGIWTIVWNREPLHEWFVCHFLAFNFVHFFLKR